LGRSPVTGQTPFLHLIGGFPRTNDSFPRHGHQVCRPIYHSLQIDPLSRQSGLPFHGLIGLCQHIRCKIAVAQDPFIADGP
jgi:hypothetical protein